MRTTGEIANTVATHALQACVAIAKSQGLTLELFTSLVRTAWGEAEPIEREPVHEITETVRLLALRMFDSGQHREAATLLLGMCGASMLAQSLKARFPQEGPLHEPNWDSMPPPAAADDRCGDCDRVLDCADSLGNKWCSRCVDPEWLAELERAAEERVIEHTEIQRFEVQQPSARYKPCAAPLADGYKCALLTGHAGRCRHR